MCDIMEAKINASRRRNGMKEPTEGSSGKKEKKETTGFGNKEVTCILTRRIRVKLWTQAYDLRRFMGK